MYFWKAYINQICFTWLEMIRKIFLASFSWATFFFWFDNVIFAWIKVANVQSQFTPTPLEVLTQFQDWELGQSVSFKIAQKFCAIFWKLPNSGDLPKFGSWRHLCLKHLRLGTASFPAGPTQGATHLVKQPINSLLQTSVHESYSRTLTKSYTPH